MHTERIQIMVNKTEQKLFCKLTSPELQRRRATVIAELRNLLVKKQPVDRGYKYFFRGQDAVLDKLTDFIKSERLCCDFFEFALYVDAATAALEITGPEGSKEFLDHEVAF